MISARPFVFSLLAGVVVLTSSWMVNVLLHAQVQREAVAVATARAQTIAAHLESAMHERLELTHGLSAFVRSRWDFSQEDFDAYAEALQDGYPEIRSLQLAPGAVVTYLTNLEQNRPAQGHDLLGDPNRRHLVEEAIANRRYISAGPLDLLQGGRALIARLPIYRPGKETARTSFWGFATVLLDPEAIIQKSGLREGTEFFEFALRGKDGLGFDGEMIAGEEAIFTNAELSVPVTLPVGTWVIAGSAREGITFHNYRLEALIWIVAIVVAGTVSFLLYARLQLPEELRRQVEAAVSAAEDERDSAKKIQVERMKAELANEAKSAFLANMSHEIRTPMNGVIGMLDVLQTTPLKDDQERMVDTIQRSAKSLLRIINDILDVSKIETGKLAIFQEPLQLCTIFEDVLNTLGPIAKEAQVELEFIWAARDVDRWVLVDGLRLKQILVNLIGNAIKFSGGSKKPTMGRVCVALERQSDGCTRFVVSDNGIGITQEQLSGLFNRFAQADETTTRQFGGAGLGLSITRDLIELMGGTISVDSHLGIGSDFEVILSLRDEVDVEKGPDLTSLRVTLLSGRSTKQADQVDALLSRAGADVEVRTEEAGVNDLDSALDLIVDLRGDEGLTSRLCDMFPDKPIIALCPSGYDGSMKAANRAGLSQLASPLLPTELLRAISKATKRGHEKPDEVQRKMALVGNTDAIGSKVLLVEDNEINREVLTAQLTRMGHLVETANDGSEGFNKWRDGRYDIVLTDCHMPVMDGYEMAKLIRREELQHDLKATTIIAITANALKSEAFKCREAGMDDHMSKPVTNADLVEKMREFG